MDFDKIIYIFFFALIISFTAAPFIINFLYKNRVWKRRQTDLLQMVANQADEYKNRTPILGGLIFIFGTVVTTVLFNLDRQYTFVPLGVLIIAATLGFTDDFISIIGRARTVKTMKDTVRTLQGKTNIFNKIHSILVFPWRMYASIFSGFNSSDRKELFPHERILIYLITGAIVAWWFYFKISWPDKDLLWLPFHLSINIGILMVPFIVIAVIGTTTAVAITDGLDGLLASLAIPAFTSFGIIAILQGSAPLAYFCATMVASLLAYLYFNIKPARVWMGDMGAVALGATLATVAVLLSKPILLLVIGLLFVIDFASSFIQVYGVKIFKRRLLPIAPIHHWFEQLGWDESKIVMRANIAAWVLCILGVWLSRT